MDTSWCPGCDTLIPPKRYIIPADITSPLLHPPLRPDSLISDDPEHDPSHPPPPPPPTPVSSSYQIHKERQPLADPTLPSDPPTRPRVRGIGGHLVHGVGRIPPGDHFNTCPATTRRLEKTRVVISQEPTPVYCSIQCCQRDFKISFLDSDSPTFSGGAIAMKHVAQHERVRNVVDVVMKAHGTSTTGADTPPSPAQPSEPRHTDRRPRNPLILANPIRNAMSITAKDRVQVPSLASDLFSPSFDRAPSQSYPLQPMGMPSSSKRYGITMWPEDEQRTTESTRVHGALLCSYGQRFQSREGRSPMGGHLRESREDAKRAGVVSSRVHDAQPHSRHEYWRAFEERQREERTRRKVAAAVEKEEEERVISELLSGQGMNEVDQPQARRMQRMAYDGMPGPAELRGLTYKFEQFLYPSLWPKVTVVQKTVRRWDEDRREWLEEETTEEIYERGKKLFNFVEDSAYDIPHPLPK